MPRRRKTALSFCVLASFAVAVSCREPTQVTLRITTGEKCSELSGVQIVVGSDQRETQQRFETHFTTALTRSCDPSGLIGTLVVAPGGHTATIVVAAGVQVAGAPAPDPAACADATTAKSCIIARRSFAFIDHTSLTLPVELDPLCIGKACDPASTCFKGTCVDAAVTCNGTDCGLVQEHPGEGDGGANEAGSSDGSYDADLDGMSFEDVSVRDAGNDTGNPVADATPDSQTGTLDGGPYPPCGSAGPNSYCYANGATGVSTPGSCVDPGDLTKSCCHCTCAGSAMVTACDVLVMSPGSCHPTCP